MLSKVKVSLSKSLFIVLSFLVLSITPLNNSYSQTLQPYPDSIPFAPAVNYGVGNRPWSVFCADLDGDGDLDLAVANYYSDSVSILMNLTNYCGDCNADGLVNSADVSCLINYLFVNGPAPVPWKAGDVNGDSNINSADVAYLINYLFVNGPPPCGQK